MARTTPPTALTATTTSGGAFHTGQEHEPDERDSKISATVDRGRPNRVVKRGAEQSDHRGVHAAHDGLGSCAFPKRLPERQRANEGKDAGHENSDEADG